MRNISDIIVGVLGGSRPLLVAARRSISGYARGFERRESRPGVSLDSCVAALDYRTHSGCLAPPVVMRSPLMDGVRVTVRLLRLIRLQNL